MAAGLPCSDHHLGVCCCSAENHIVGNIQIVVISSVRAAVVDLPSLRSEIVEKHIILKGHRTASPCLTMGVNAIPRSSVIPSPVIKRQRAVYFAFVVPKGNTLPRDIMHHHIDKSDVCHVGRHIRIVRADSVIYSRSNTYTGIFRLKTPIPSVAPANSQRSTGCRGQHRSLPRVLANLDRVCAGTS